jgi:ribosomal protein L16 Arg81 hydroxylase
MRLLALVALQPRAPWRKKERIRSRSIAKSRTGSDFQDFLKGEVRYASVNETVSYTEADELFEAAEENATMALQQLQALSKYRILTIDSNYMKVGPPQRVCPTFFYICLADNE